MRRPQMRRPQTCRPLNGTSLMKTKHLLPLREAITDPRCPFDNERQLYQLKDGAKPTFDSAGKLVDPGDPEILSCFVRPSGRARGPMFLDLSRFEEVMRRRRLSTLAGLSDAA